MESTMKAYGFRKFGGAEVMEVMELPKPGLKANTVLIRVAAAGVNPADVVARSGALKLFIRPPFVPGLEVAGVVEAVGAEVKRFKPGDAVYAMLPNTRAGGYAAYAAVAEKAVAVIPAGLSFEEAAAIPVGALTALQALRDKVHLQPGTHLLINGASGGVGTFAVQIAKAMGARVTATCSGRNVELVRGLGADEVIDYTTTNILSGERQFDLIFDAVGVYSFKQWKPALKVQGTLVTVNPLFGNPLAAFLSRFGNKRLTSIFVQPSGADLQQLNQWVEARKMRVVLERVYALENCADAQRTSETKRVRGKLALVVDAALAQTRSRDYSLVPV
ncbi:MAG: NAD(P)-dependent alcohol dehydrogenase [bacterium]|nr:NAD(P)-dependent alcohol dehydrogenase [bacterium]